MIHQVIWSHLLNAVMGKFVNRTEADNPGASIPDNIEITGRTGPPSDP